MNTNLKNALVSLGKFVGDKTGFITLNGFNAEMWAVKLAALAEMEYGVEYALSYCDIAVAKCELLAVMPTEFRMTEKYWTVLLLQQAYACKGLSVAKAVKVLFVAKTTRMWHASEALQNFINISDLTHDRFVGVTACNRMMKQISRSQMMQQEAMKASSGDVFDLARAAFHGYNEYNTDAPIRPVSPFSKATKQEEKKQKEYSWDTI